jgi:hypothetical protein
VQLSPCRPGQRASERVVTLKHDVRNALLPVVPVLALDFGHLGKSPRSKAFSLTRVRALESMQFNNNEMYY